FSPISWSVPSKLPVSSITTPLEGIDDRATNPAARIHSRGSAQRPGALRRYQPDRVSRGTGFVAGCIRRRKIESARRYPRCHPALGALRSFGGVPGRGITGAGYLSG